MARRVTVGDVSITAVAETAFKVPITALRHADGERLAEMRWLPPGSVTPASELQLVVQAFVLETAQGIVVVDPCAGNHKKRSYAQLSSLDTGFMARLQEAGFPPESVDLVVSTHLHFDHIGWNTWHDGTAWVPTFPNARYVYRRDEWEQQAANPSADAAAAFKDSLEPLWQAGLVDLVEEDHAITPEARFLPTPGHTPGHASIEIVSSGARSLITGDALHHQCQVAVPEWATAFDHDRHTAAATRLALMEQLVDTGVLVAGTHFATEPFGRVVSDATAARFVPER